MKEAWEKKRRAGELGLGNPWWDYYIDLYLKTNNLQRVTIECDKKMVCGAGITNDNFAWKPFRRCKIKLGCNPCFVPRCDFETLANALVHEITHCVQYSEDGKPTDCAEVLCREIKAYYHGDRDPDRLISDPRNLIALAWSSAYQDKRCKGHQLKEFMPDTEQGKRELVGQCVGDLKPPQEINRASQTIGLQF